MLSYYRLGFQIGFENMRSKSYYSVGGVLANARPKSCLIGQGTEMPRRMMGRVKLIST